MKNKKRLLALGLAAVMTAGTLAACGGGDDGSAGNSGSSGDTGSSGGSGGEIQACSRLQMNGLRSPALR